MSNESFRDTIDYVHAQEGACRIGGNMEGEKLRELARPL
jgi:hypothetical protein